MELDEFYNSQLPVMCSCGGENVMEYDFLTNRYQIFCECGTRLEINAEEWHEATYNAKKGCICK